MKVLITAGNTVAPIDKVRCITNIFKGRTGANIAKHFDEQGEEVTLLTSNVDFAKRIIGSFSATNIVFIDYKTYDDLIVKMEELIKNGDFDLIIHSSAVSDYTVDGVYKYSEYYGGTFTANTLSKIDSSGKVGSDYDEIYLKLVPTKKIVDLIKTEWGFKGKLVKFKLQVDMSDEELLEVATKSMHHSGADFIVANCLEWSMNSAYIIDARDDYSRKCVRSQLPEVLYGFIYDLPGYTTAGKS